MVSGSRREERDVLGGELARELLEARLVANLATIDRDGAVHLVGMWFLWDGEALLLPTSRTTRKAKNIARDPRVTVCVQDERPPYASVTVYGKAAIEPAQEELGVRIAKHYLGAVGAAGYQRAAREAIEGAEEVTLVITPERVLSQDFSPETPWFGKAWLVLKRVLPPGL